MCECRSRWDVSFVDLKWMGKMPGYLLCMPSFVKAVSAQLRRHVIDRTGRVSKNIVMKYYRFNLDWAL